MYRATFMRSPCSCRLPLPISVSCSSTLMVSWWIPEPTCWRPGRRFAGNWGLTFPSMPTSRRSASPSGRSCAASGSATCPTAPKPSIDSVRRATWRRCLFTPTSPSCSTDFMRRGAGSASLPPRTASAPRSCSSGFRRSFPSCAAPTAPVAANRRRITC